MRNSMRRVRTFVLGGRGGVPSPNESPQQHVDVPRDELVESKFWIWLFGHESSVIELLPAYIQASTTLSSVDHGMSAFSTLMSSVLDNADLIKRRIASFSPASTVGSPIVAGVDTRKLSDILLSGMDQALTYALGAVRMADNSPDQPPLDWALQALRFVSLLLSNVNSHSLPMLSDFVVRVAKFANLLQHALGDIIKSGSTESRHGRFAVEALLEYVHIVQQCIDPHSRWGSYLLRWNLEQTDSVLVADTALARNEKLVAEMLDALINILSTLRTPSREPTSPQVYKLHSELLHCTGALLLSETSLQETFMRRGGVEIVLQTFGWPSVLLDKSGALLPMSSLGDVSAALQSEFRIQLVAWHVLFVATTSNWQAVQRQLSPTYERGHLTSFFLWVAYAGPSGFKSSLGCYDGLDVFPLCPSFLPNAHLGSAQGTPAKKPPPPPQVEFPLTIDYGSQAPLPTGHPVVPVVDDIAQHTELDILFRMAASCFIWSIEQSSQGRNLAESTAMPIVSGVLGMFNAFDQGAADANSKAARAAMTSYVPQFLFIQFLCMQLIQGDSHRARIANNETLFRVLLSPTFLPWNPSRAAQSKLLRSNTLAFAIYLLSMPDVGIAHVLVQLMAVLESYQETVEMVLELCQCIRSIMLAKPEQTQQVLMNDASLGRPPITVLTSILTKHSSLARAAPDSLPDVFIRARWCALSALGVFLDGIHTAPVHAFVARHAFFLDLLCLHLFDADEEIAEFALARYMRLLQCIGLTGNTTLVRSLLVTLLDNLAMRVASPETAATRLRAVKTLSLRISVSASSIRDAFAAPTSAVGGMPVGRAMLSIDSTIEEIIRLLLVLLSTDELRQSMCEAVLGCLSSFCRASREFRTALVGKDDLRGLWEACVTLPSGATCAPWEGLVVAWAGLVVDGTYDPEGRHTISISVGAVRLIEMARGMADAMQEFTIDVVAKLARMSDLNRMRLCAQGVYGELILILKNATTHMRINQVTQLLQTIGSYSISDEELLAMLALLKKDNVSGQLPACFSAVLSSLTHMAQHSMEAPSSFHFTGKNSGIALPTFDLSAAPGFSFMAWIRIDDVTQGGLPYRPRIFSLCSSEGGVESSFDLFVEDGHFALGVQKSGQRAQSAPFPTSSVPLSRWFHVALCLEGVNRKWAATHAYLYIDGREVARRPCPFPSMLAQSSMSRVGTSLVALDDTEAVHLSKGTEPSLFGSMGAVYLFKSALPPVAVEQAHSLGPLYNGVFEPEEVSVESRRFPALFSGELSSSLAVAFSPSATRGDSLIDVAAGVLGRLRHTEVAQWGPVAAAPEIVTPDRVVGTLLNVSCSAHPVFGSVIQSVGGRTSDARPVVSPPAVLFVELIAALLASNPRNQLEFHSTRCAALLSHLLQQGHPSHYESAVPVLQRLAASVRKDAPELAYDIHKYLLRDPYLWVYHTNIAFHCSMFSALASHTPSPRKGAVKSAYPLSVTTLLRMLDRFYWSSPSEESCPHTKTLHINGSDLVLSRPEEDQRQVLYDYCIKLVDEQMTQMSTAYLDIAQFLLLADDVKLSFGIYQIMALHVQQRSLDLFWSGAAGDVILDMLDSDYELNRLLSIHLIAMVLCGTSITEKARKRFRLDEFGGLEMLKFVWRGGASQDMINALEQLVLEKSFYDIRTMKLNSMLLEAGNHHIVNISAVLLVLSLVSQAAPSFRAGALANITSLCVGNPINFEGLAASPAVLLALVRQLAKLKVGDDVSGESQAAVRVVDLVIDLVCRMFHSACEADLKAWQIIEKTLILAMAHNVSPTLWFRHKLLTRALGRSVPTGGDPRIQNNVAVNMTQTLLLAENVSLLLSEGERPSDDSDSALACAKIQLYISAAAEGDVSHEHEHELLFAAVQVSNALPGGRKEAFSSDVKTKRTGGLQSVGTRMALLLVRSPTPEHVELGAAALRVTLETYLNPKSGILSRDDNEWKNKALGILAHLSAAYDAAVARGAPVSVARLQTVFKFALRKYSFLLTAGGTLSESALADEAGDIVFMQLLQSAEWKANFDQHVAPRLDDMRVSAQAVCDVTQRRVDKKLKGWFARLRDQETRLQANAKRFKETLKYAGKWQDNAMFEQTMSGHRRNVAKLFKSAMIDLRAESPLWRQDPGEQHWMMDPSENALGMRRKLRANHAFSDHADAAMRRDRVGTPSAGKSVNLEQFGGRAVVNGEDESSDDEDATDVAVSQPETAEVTLSDEEQLLFSCECELVVLMSAIKGRLELTTRRLIFTVTDQQLLADTHKCAMLDAMDGNALRDRAWPLADVTDVYFRLFLLRKSAIELFFRDKTSVFYNLPSHEKQLLFVRHIRSLRRIAPIRVGPRTATEAFTKSQSVTQSWSRGEMSNFEYIMYLNRISGRTYHDLTQYPVFPWVIADYTSTSLDLSSERTFRDLSKPIGALNETRLKMFLTRFEHYEDLSERKVPPFMYGTHYSTSASILFYLVRMEPFTTLGINLQGGRFDHADRLFHSIPEAWTNCLTNPTDVKELIPEFFYLDEFLENSNGFDLGARQNGERLGNVVLPPWAATPGDFVRLNREALESDYVSQHLHLWIDLIWGFKQRGREAIRANNVFHHFTYEGSVNIDTIDDPLEKSAIKAQIGNFGQTPSQLTRKPHPKRMAETVAKPWDGFMTAKQMNMKAEAKPTELPLLFMYYVRSTGMFAAFDEARSIFFLRPRSMEIDAFTNESRGLGVPLSRDMPQTSSSFAATSDGRFVVTCGFWDASFRCYMTEGLKQQFCSDMHEDVVMCVALSEDDRVLATGGRDRLVYVWGMEYAGGTCSLSSKPRKVLRGHNDHVVAVAVNSSHDIVVSGSKDGACHIYNLLTGEFVRRLDFSSSPTLSLPRADSVAHLLIHPDGLIYAVTASSQSELSHSLWLFSINARLVGAQHLGTSSGRRSIPARPTSIFSGALSAASSQALLRAAFNVSSGRDVGSIVMQIAVLPGGSAVFVACADGKLRAYDAYSLAALSVPAARAQVSSPSSPGASAPPSGPSVRCIAFGPSSAPRLATGMANGTVRVLWNDGS